MTTHLQIKLRLGTIKQCAPNQTSGLCSAPNNLGRTSKCRLFSSWAQTLGSPPNAQLIKGRLKVIETLLKIYLKKHWNFKTSSA